MKKSAQKFRLGLFVIISSSMLIFIIMYFTSRAFFEKTDTYYVAYHNVSVGGMQVGSPVKYLGIKVGTISDIMIDPDDINNIIVELSLEPGTPIKEDTKADIVSLGITGLKAIEIRGGSNRAPLLKKGQYIHPGKSLTEEITGKAEVITEKIEKVLNNLQVFTAPENLDKVVRLANNLDTLIQNTDKTVANINQVIIENQDEVETTITSAQELSGLLLESGHSLQLAIGKINEYVYSDTISQILANAKMISDKISEKNIEELIDNLAKITIQTQQLLVKVDSDINRSSKDLSESQQLLKLTLENLNEAARQINNNPSVLLRGTKKKNLPDKSLNY